MYFLYSVLSSVAMLLLLPYWLVRGLKHKKYLSNLGQRLGRSFPYLNVSAGSHSKAIWLHAVSVGEVLAAVTLARRLKTLHPERRLIVSATTLTGLALARERMPFADGFLYFPLDWRFAVRPAFKAVDPELVIIVETEIWPNFLREAHERKIPVLFVSGRISDRSFTRYQNYLGKLGPVLRPFLHSVLGIPKAFLMQGETDAKRLRLLGAPSDRVRFSGNLKYDLELPSPTPFDAWLKAEAHRRGLSPIIIAGSVVATEEPLALIAFGVLQGEYRDAFLVLAPRKPERFEAAAEFIHESRRKFIRRSQLAVPSPLQQAAVSAKMPLSAAIPDDVTVLLLDSIGELASLYQLGDGVFVGGSLVESGGHNILEPAAFGKVPVFGPSMENFAEMAQRFVAADAGIQVTSPEDAGVSWIELLRDPERMKQMGERARHLVEDSRGATDRALAEVVTILGGKP